MKMKFGIGDMNLYSTEDKGYGYKLTLRTRTLREGGGFDVRLTLNKTLVRHANPAHGEVLRRLFADVWNMAGCFGYFKYEEARKAVEDMAELLGVPTNDDEVADASREG